MSKRDFSKHLKSSNFFLKSFDKNKDGVITEVGTRNRPVKPEAKPVSTTYFGAKLVNLGTEAFGNNYILVRLKC